MTPPEFIFIFRIVFDGCRERVVKAADWNRGGAWANLCRDINRGEAKPYVDAAGAPK